MIKITQQISAVATQEDIERMLTSQINSQLGTKVIINPVFQWDNGKVTVVGNQEDQATATPSTSKVAETKQDESSKIEEVLKQVELPTPFKAIETTPIVDKVAELKSTSGFVIAKPLTLDEKVAEAKAASGIPTKANFSATGNTQVSFKLP